MNCYYYASSAERRDEDVLGKAFVEESKKQLGSLGQRKGKALDKVF